MVGLAAYLGRVLAPAGERREDLVEVPTRTIGAQPTGSLRGVAESSAAHQDGYPHLMGHVGEGDDPREEDRKVAGHDERVGSAPTEKEGDLATGCGRAQESHVQTGGPELLGEHVTGNRMPVADRARDDDPADGCSVALGRCQSVESRLGHAGGEMLVGHGDHIALPLVAHVALGGGEQVRDDSRVRGAGIEHVHCLVHALAGAPRDRVVVELHQVLSEVLRTQRETIR